MFIRSFLKIVRPSSKHLMAGGRNGKYMQIYIAAYKYIITQLKKVYSYYAISDTISLENGAIRIVHECRDIEFENELKRIGVDIHSHLQKMQMPVNYSKKMQPFFYRFFKWNNQLTVCYDNKEMTIYRGYNISIEGTLNSKVLMSLPTDVIYRCHIDVQSNHAAKETENQEKPVIKRTTATKQGGETNKGRIFSKEITPSTKTRLSSSSSGKSENETTKLAKRGFEIDTTF